MPPAIHAKLNPYLCSFVWISHKFLCIFQCYLTHLILLYHVNIQTVALRPVLVLRVLPLSLSKPS